MPFYTSTEQLYAATRVFFDRVGKEYPHAGDAILKQKMTVRLATVEPAGVFGLDGRHSPLKSHIGTVPFRPDLDIEMPADMLHAILLGQTSIKSGLASGKLKARGAIWKALSLSEPLSTGAKGLSSGLARTRPHQIARSPHCLLHSNPNSCSIPTSSF